MTNISGRLSWLFTAAYSSVLFILCSGAQGKTPPVQKDPAWVSCYAASGAKWGISTDLLRGIAKLESRENPQAVSPVGALGVMQIDKSWLKKLGTFGISKSDLLDPCTNIDVGAWILSSELKGKGNRWEAVGAYNAACTQLKGQACTSQRAWYAWKVYQHMPKNEGQKTRSAPQVRKPHTPLQAVLVKAEE